MKKILLVLFLILPAAVATAQDNFIFEMPNDFEQLDTTRREAKFKSIHMVGVQYGVNWSGVSASPKIGADKIFTYHNYGVFYTYYHALWDYMFNFGLKFGVTYGQEGYVATRYDMPGELCTVVNVPLISQFKIDFLPFRLLINIGTYGGYRLETDKAGGFDKYDQRVDYGVLGGLGLAFVLNPFELHLEANYKYAFASMYHTNKISDIYWMYTYPQNLLFSASLHFHLW
ncbi:MAG: hypothetical protein K6G79_02855 [Bacteroidales bacterium]|nr:hypothetical protein [Bacteroidales bacterium]